ncbi:hypothetical protein PG985_000705 [Apiospora marii]|uniref:Uncharacterized protein n=1 Tax=Apiospora marii TaxID=335849 RepID=A0ABR1R3V9_9PEZI
MIGSTLAQLAWPSWKTVRKNTKSPIELNAAIANSRVFWAAAGLLVISYVCGKESRTKHQCALEMTTSCAAGNDEETLPLQPRKEEEESCSGSQEIRTRLESIDERVNAIWEKLQEITGSSPVSFPSAAVDAASDNDEPGEGGEPVETPLTHAADGGDAGPGYLVIW